MTALRVAAENNQLTVVKTLLSYTEKVQISKKEVLQQTSNHGDTPLLAAMESGLLEQACSNFADPTASASAERSNSQHGVVGAAEREIRLTGQFK
ncbi:MAG: hypothetical protein AAHH96_06480 [Candidatus Symbiodolus clandestinus]